MQNTKIKNLPKDDRPREKALKYGINICSNSELLAIILGSGTKKFNVLEVAQNILQNVGNIKNLETLSLPQLCEFEGISKVRALQLQAAILLGIRINNSGTGNLTIKDYNSKEIYNNFRNELLENFQEKALLIFINKGGHIISKREFTGTTFNINMDFNTIKCLFYEFEPNKLLIMHTHVEGTSEPSNEDINLTIAIEKLCKEFNTLLLDHIIISRCDYFSFKDAKFLNN